MGNCEVLTIPNGRPYMDGRCYVLVCRESGCAAVADPDLCARAVQALLKEQGLKLSYVLLTHGHFDHTGSAQELAQTCDVPVYIHPLDAPMLADPAKNLSGAMGGQDAALGVQTRALRDGQHLRLGTGEITVLHTPGHTPGSCSFLWGDGLIGGDLLFRGGVGRTDLPGGDARQLAASLRRVAALPPDTAVYPGHGGSTVLGAELSVPGFYMGD